MKVFMPARILDRQVGGNTTYARNVARGLVEKGISVERIGAGANPAHTALLETTAALRRKPPRSILHYVADTGPLVRTRTPAAVTVHGVASRWISTARTASQEFVWRQRVAAAIRNTSKIITVSESSADDVAEVFDVPRSDISVIHHGIDTDIFQGPARLSSEAGSKLPKDFCLYVGNIEPRKNLISLIAAVDDLASDSEALPLVIAGRPAWNYEETLKAIASSPNVIYLGFVSDEDRRALMQKCKLFVFPSLYEGFGFPILEAMAAGAPVLTTDKGSLAEVRGPARLIEDTTSDSIGGAIADAIRDAAWLETSGSRGQEWASTFSWNKSVAEHIKVYEGLLA